ncbi:MAG: D-2-hydroxyacid dehydrogenase [Clostridia bacterium]|jgi:glycerate dehydrogenase
MKVCILDSKTLGNDVDLSVFEKYGDVNIYKTTKPSEVIERIRNCEIVLVNKVRLNESNLDDASLIKLICLTSTGTNNVNLEYAKAKGIAVTNVAGYSTKSVAQHTFAMLFYILEHLKYYDEYVKTKKYSKSDIFTNLDKSFSEINGKTWGIIGLGSIGATVAKIAESFGCNVMYFSTSGKNDNTKYKRVSLDYLLKQSDIVSIHAPLNSQTTNLIDGNELNKMKESAVLLNLGRGGIVNEESLANALDENRIAGACLDVLVNEPIEKKNPLLKINEPDRLLITPHIAWGSIEARQRLIDELMMNIDAFIEGKQRNRVV